MAKTWDINQGFEIDCRCANSGSTATVNVYVDLDPITNKLDQIIAQGNTSNNTLSDILTELIDINSPLTQTIITTAVAGSIPAGVQSYSIFNMGITPADPNTTYNPMIVNGLSISSRYVQFGNSTDSTKVLSNGVNYDPNGNTLLITYNS